MVRILNIIHLLTFLKLFFIFLFFFWWWKRLTCFAQLSHVGFESSTWIAHMLTCELYRGGQVDGGGRGAPYKRGPLFYTQSKQVKLCSIYTYYNLVLYMVHCINFLLQNSLSIIKKEKIRQKGISLHSSHYWMTQVHMKKIIVYHRQYCQNDV